MTQQKFETGALVKVTKDTEGKPLRRDDVFMVDDYVSREQSEDGVPFYWLDRQPSMTGTVTAYEEDITLHLSAEEASNRKPPTAKSLLKGFEFLTEGDGWETDESDIQNDHTIEVYGRTEDGVRFGCTVAITQVVETDF